MARHSVHSMCRGSTATLGQLTPPTHASCCPGSLLALQVATSGGGLQLLVAHELQHLHNRALHQCPIIHQRLQLRGKQRWALGYAIADREPRSLGRVAILGRQQLHLCAAEGGGQQCSVAARSARAGLHCSCKRSISCTLARRWRSPSTCSVMGQCAKFSEWSACNKAPVDSCGTSIGPRGPLMLLAVASDIFRGLCSTGGASREQQLDA